MCSIPNVLTLYRWAEKATGAGEDGRKAGQGVISPLREIEAEEVKEVATSNADSVEIAEIHRILQSGPLETAIVTRVIPDVRVVIHVQTLLLLTVDILTIVAIAAEKWPEKGQDRLHHLGNIPNSSDTERFDHKFRQLYSIRQRETLNSRQKLTWIPILFCPSHSTLLLI